MKLLPLSQGLFAKVDNADFASVNKYKWTAAKHKKSQTFYVLRRQKGLGQQPTIYLARELLGLKYGDKRDADYLNGNTLDCQRSNLRVTTRRKNKRNCKAGRLLGAIWDKRNQCWVSRIWIGSVRKYLGSFATDVNAHKAYLEAVEKL